MLTAFGETIQTDFDRSDTYVGEFRELAKSYHMSDVMMSRFISIDVVKKNILKSKNS